MKIKWNSLLLFPGIIQIIISFIKSNIYYSLVRNRNFFFGDARHVSDRRLVVARVAAAAAVVVVVGVTVVVVASVAVWPVVV